jgi:hypothetical protein
VRTIAFVIFVFALGVSFSIVGATGIADTWGLVDAPGGGEVERQLEDSAANSSAGNEDQLSGDVGKSGGETNLIGLVVAGVQTIGRVAAAIILLPLTLVELGMPVYAAVPVGFFAQIITGIGIVEFATGREYT